MSEENKLIIDGVEYNKSDFSDEQADLDHRITRLMMEAKDHRDRAEELTLAADILISRLADSLENKNQDISDDDILS
jgi:uncharacterized protein YllA (UPF0747 family)